MDRDATSTRIVVPIDASEFSTLAVPAAASIAKAAGAGITFVAVGPDDREADSLSSHLDEATQLLPPGLDVSVQAIVDSDPAAVLLHLAAEPDNVLCLATHDHMPAARAVLGSVGSQVIERAVRPLFVTGAAGAITPGTDVAVALDGRHDPEPLLAAAVGWARSLDAPLRLVTVYEPVLADIRRPEHFTRARGPSIDVDLYLDEIRARLQGSGVRSVEVASISDPVGVVDGLAAHLGERPALVLVVGGEHHPHLVTPGVLRRLLSAVPVPVLLVPRVAAQATTVRDAEGRWSSES
jgi:nucleotide-binding universal stress UspA family protein